MAETEPLTIATWLWTDPQSRINQRDYSYGARHVNILGAMLDRHLGMEYEFVCITDTPAGIDTSIECIDLWPDLRHMGRCYTRLKVFEKGFDLLGPRFASIDLDTVIVGDVTAIFSREEEFIAWGDLNNNTHYCGSLFMMDAGSHPEVWDEFSPEKSPRLTQKARMVGSDQAWMSYAIGPEQAIWDDTDGVVSYRYHCQKLCGGGLPPGARIVNFHGCFDPIQESTKLMSPWIREYWKL